MLLREHRTQRLNGQDTDKALGPEPLSLALGATVQPYWSVGLFLHKDDLCLLEAFSTDSFPDLDF